MDGIGTVWGAFLVLVTWSIANSNALWEMARRAATPGASRSRLLVPAILTWLWAPAGAVVVGLEFHGIDLSWTPILAAAAAPPAATLLVVTEWLRRHHEDRTLGRPRPVRRP